MARVRGQDESRTALCSGRSVMQRSDAQTTLPTDRHVNVEPGGQEWQESRRQATRPAFCDTSHARRTPYSPIHATHNRVKRGKDRNDVGD